MINAPYGIVADVGGTSIRFSRVHIDTLYLDKYESYMCKHFLNFTDALKTYQKKHGLQAIKRIAIAIAGPVTDDYINMTNCNWSFSLRQLQNELGLSQLKVLNDFSAIALSTPFLQKNELMQIGQGEACINKPKVVLGSGTGLGVAYVFIDGKNYTVGSGEGGHVNWGPQNKQECFIYKYLKHKYQHVSYERILSGPGLEDVYQAIGAYHHKQPAKLIAARIIILALQNKCNIASLTIEQFFTTLASYAGDLALIFGATGGVYIAGGIAPRLLQLLSPTVFRANFERKGRFNEFNSLIPTYIIIAKQPGLLGAATFLAQF